VGRFHIQGRLGGGGMGEVYLAEDAGLKRQVALKRIAPAFRTDAKSRQRLWKEAECASRLHDPHIAAVYDVIEEGDEVFVVMEYVEGETLRGRLSRALTIDEFLAIATQCASALSAAHQAGLLHRDIKPENIMLTPSGEIKTLDFGLALELPDPDAATIQETIERASFTGTLLYMAPESLQQKRADARADIFSLGVVFYEALAGQNPFHRAGFLETCDAILYEEPPPLRERNRGENAGEETGEPVCHRHRSSSGPRSFTAGHGADQTAQFRGAPQTIFEEVGGGDFFRGSPWHCRPRRNADLSALPLLDPERARLDSSWRF
jgi:serine/threonine protein kinase